MEWGSWHCTGDRDQDHPHGKEMHEDKMLSDEALQIAEERREAKGKGEKESYTHLNAELQRIARRDKKAFLRDQYKEIDRKNRMGKTRDLFKKIKRYQGNLCSSHTHITLCFSFSSLLLWWAAVLSSRGIKSFQTMTGTLREHQKHGRISENEITFQRHLSFCIFCILWASRNSHTPGSLFIHL